MTSALKGVALQREVELLWLAAETEKERADTLQSNFNDCQLKLEDAVDTIAALRYENAQLVSAAESAQGELDSRTTHYRQVVLQIEQQYAELQARAATESASVADGELAVTRQRQHFDAMLLQSTALHDNIQRFFAQSSRICEEGVGRWIVGAEDTLRTMALGLRAAVSRQFRELADAVEQWVSKAHVRMLAWQRGTSDALDVALSELLRPSAKPLAVADTQGNSNDYREYQTHTDKLLCNAAAFSSATLALQANYYDTLVSSFVSSVPDSIDAAPTTRRGVVREEPVDDRRLQLEDDLLAMERRVASRDQLIATLRRRAEVSEEALVRLQEELHTHTILQREAEGRLEQRANRIAELEKIVHAFEERDKVPQQLLSNIATSRALQRSPEGDTSSIETRSLGAEDVGRKQATDFLREQLERQLELVQRIEGSERSAAQERAAGLLHAALIAAAERLSSSLLEERAEWLVWAGAQFEEQRLVIRSELIQAAEQMSELARRRQTLEELVAGKYTATGGSSSALVEQPFQLASMSLIADVTLHAGGIGGAAVLDCSRRTQHTFMTGNEMQRMLTPQQLHHMREVAGAVAALFLEVKLEFNTLLLTSQRHLLRMFWALAPKERAAAHVRVHILEGALAVSEAQRAQSLTVAQWLEEQCLSAKSALDALLIETRDALIPSDSRMIASLTTRPMSLVHASSGGGQWPFGSDSDHVADRLGEETVERFIARDNSSAAAMHNHAAVDAALQQALSAELARLKQSHAATDRRALADLHSAQLTCDRLLEVLVSHHRRLVDAESQLQHCLGDVMERQAESQETKHHLDRSILTHSLEQEIADDIVWTLRGMLNEERLVAQASMAALLCGAEDRNSCIAELQLTVLNTHAMARSALHQAQYVEAAMSLSMDNYGEFLVAVGRLIRTAGLRSSEQTEFLLLSIHFEFGVSMCESLTELHRGVRRSMKYVLSVQGDMYTLRRQLADAAASLTQLHRDRDNERAVSDMLQTFVRSSLTDFAVTLHSTMPDVVLSLRDALVYYAHRYANVGAELAELQLTTQNQKLQLREAAAELTEHAAAVSASSEAVEAIERVLADKIAAVRDRDFTILSLQQRAEELEGLLVTLKNQLVVYHQLLTAAGEEREAQAAALRSAADLERRTAEELARAKSDLESVSDMLESERGAHRATIRSITDMVELKPKNTSATHPQ